MKPRIADRGHGSSTPPSAGAPTVLDAPAVAGDLAALRTAYVRALPAKVAALQTTVEAAWRAPDPISIGAARDQAHQLRGSAGSYGVPTVSAAAGVIEDLLVTMLDDRREQPSVGWGQIEASLAEAADAAVSPPFAGGLRPSSAPAAAVSTERLRVLVVDKNADFSRLVRDVGSEHLVAIVTATTAHEAMAEAGRARFDAAMIDVLLEPPGAAFQLARALRAMRGTMDLPIAFVSDSTDIHDRIAATQIRGSLYLTKPAERAALADTLERLTTSRSRTIPRVLVVDDDPDAGHRIAVVLRDAGMETTIHLDAAGIFEALEKDCPDLLVLDLSMPDVNGLELCRVLRAAPRWHDLAIVFLSGRADRKSRLQAFQAGADDFVDKSDDTQEIVARIRSAADRARTTKGASGRDWLTGLWLRARFLEEFSSRLREARRHRQPLSLVLLDLDDFKGVNDEHGHRAGDQVLIALAALLRRCFRSDDLRARWGGEEFMIALPGQRPDAAAAVVGRLLYELRATEFRGAGDCTFRVTFSAGVAAFPDDGDDLEQITEAADRCLYRAKRDGRARVVRTG